MTLRSQLRPSPIPFFKEPAKAARAEWADLGADVADLIAGIAGCSPYLAGLLAREGAWLRNALSGSSHEALAQALMLEGDLGPGLRQAKRRMGLLLALGDLGGAFSLEDVTGGLTRLADWALEEGLARLVSEAVAKGQLPETERPAGGLFALAMGKMGARELNYSSDIDLIFLFDEGLYPAEEYASVRKVFIRIVQRLVRLLSDVTEDGYVFRTDLRLRPDPSVTPVVIGMGAAERYYEAEGRGWERAAMIKARAAAGDISAGEGFLEALQPFIWRRHLDFASIEDAHAMRQKIRIHKGLGGAFNLAGHNVKLGQGGIREIEFFAQTHQLILGGRQQDLRLRETIPALKALAAGGWIPEDLAAHLADAYIAHRQLEHRLQMLDDAQTHLFPEAEDARRRLAAFCGEEDRAAFEAKESARFEAVHREAEAFFAPEQVVSADWQACGDAAENTKEAWERLPALRSERARSVFRRLEPRIAARLATARAPGEALAAFDRFLSGLPAGVQVFSLFDANPDLLDLLVEICATAPRLADYLGRHAGVLDAVLARDFFEPIGNAESLAAALKAELAEIGDYERCLDHVRIWLRERHFRIGVQSLRGVASRLEAARGYTVLADAVLAALLPVVTEEFARRFGPPPGAGLAVVAMGKLGSRDMTAGSDLDLIMIYDGQGEEISEGPKPLPTPLYYARLTKALISALTVPTSEGELYEVDMRLRPSGKQGPVATSLSAFARYQREEAWTWEHLALTRARVVAGSASLQERVRAAILKGLDAARPRAEILADVREMRARLLEAKGDGGPWEVKSGPGRLLDMDLFLQAGALITGERDISSPSRMISRLAATGFLSGYAAQRLNAAYILFATIQHLARVAVPGVLERAAIGKGVEQMLLRETGYESLDRLEQELSVMAEDVGALIDESVTG